MVATAIIGSAIIGGVGSIIASKNAAKAQTSSANQATSAQLDMFNRTQANTQPYINAGTAGENALMAALPGIAAPISLDQNWLENTPGYKFNLAQGLKGVYNSASARGLGASGAALKGAGAYATGLADSTYQNQFSNALANKQMALGALSTPVTIGANAAAGLGNQAVNTGTNIGNNITGAGNAQAASYISQGNAVGNTSNSLAMAMMGKQLGLF